MTQTVEPTQTKEWSPQEIHELLGLTVPSETFEEEEREVETEVLGEEAKPEKPKRKGFAKNPWLKLGLISLITGTGALFVGLVLLKGTTLKLQPTATTGADPNSSSGNPAASKEDTLQQRNAKLTGEVAIAQQKEQLKAIKAKVDQQQIEKVPQVKVEKPVTVPSPVIVAPSPSPPKVVSSEPVSRSVIYSARPVALPPPVTTPQPRSQPRVPSQRLPFVSSISSTQKSDPIAQWQTLATLGSYGNGVGKTENSSVSVSELIPLDPPKVAKSPKVADHSTAMQPQLQAGQTVSARLLTPIIWADGLPSDRFVVQLTEPLNDRGGEKILPEGTEVIFSVQQVHSSGMVIAQSVSVIVEGQEYPVPSDGLKLRRKKGKPLLAQLAKNNQGQIAGRDAMSFFFGALGKVGEISNRPTSSSSYSSFAGSSTSVNYGNPNYLGAVLEGGFSPLVQQIQQRNQAAIQALENQPALWWVGSGAELEIQIDRSFSLGESDEGAFK